MKNELRNENLVRQLAKQVENAHHVLSLATKQGHPVVYAVRSDRKWVYQFAWLTTGDCHAEPFGGIGIRDLSADRIVARVDYPNGISPDSE